MIGIVNGLYILFRRKHMIYGILHESEALCMHTFSGVEYVKVVLKEGRMMGTVLIGETDLEVI